MTRNPLSLAHALATAALACSLSLAGGANAQAAADHAGHGAAAGGSASTEAYRAANEAMHQAMDIEFTDDADIDFARGMIGHHQGAIAMANIVLEHGDDPELRALAEAIIVAQEGEILMLETWLATNAPN